MNDINNEVYSIINKNKEVKCTGSISELLRFLDNRILTVIYDVGLDNYLTKNISNRNYKEICSEYMKLFEERKAFVKENIDFAFNYFEKYIEGITILIEKNGKFENMLMDGKEQIDIIKELYNKRANPDDVFSKYSWLDSFIKYTDGKRMKLERNKNNE